MTTQIVCGDVEAVLAGLPDNTFSGVFCDPPYGLSFMGKKWDYDVPSVALWRAVFRVLRPGAPLLAFGGTRTYHRMVVNIEDGGFEIRDQLAWMYGSGFPKSLDVSKALDKAAGTEAFPQEARVPSADGRPWERNPEGAPLHTFERLLATPLAQEWQGYGTALKPAHEPIVLARKPLDGTVAENVARWGAGGLAIDACRIGDEERHNPSSSGTGMWSSFDQGESTGRPPVGRWPANVILSHADDCRLVGTRPSKDNSIKTKSTGKVTSKNVAMGGPNYGRVVVGRTPRPDEEVWECVDGCPVKMLDAQSGDRPGGRPVPAVTQSQPHAQSGGASRFFYCPKVSTKERNAGCDALPTMSGGEATDRVDGSDGLNSPRAGAGRGGGNRNNHPTLKPLALAEYLARLITPPVPGVLLVPFAGSGSEMIGATRAGWSDVLGIERDPDYVRIALARMAHYIG